MKSHELFFATYFRHFLKYPSAPIHKQLLNITQDDKLKLAIVMAFRGCGKSTICTTSYPLWAVLGEQQKKLVLIVSRNLQQAERHLDNVRFECERNDRLRKDFGRVFEDASPWNNKALSFENSDAQIVAISLGESMRGIRFGAYRPDLIILDDLEDLASVKTKESREKLFKWFSFDLKPAGSGDEKIILIGNNLHQDSLLNRLIDRHEKNQLKATVIRQPIQNEDGSIAWPGRFPTQENLLEFKATIPSDRAWQQEYMLQNISPEDQIIKDHQLHFYEDIPNMRVEEVYAVGIDLAIAKNERADKTAMIQALVQGKGEDQKIYILPRMINTKLNGIENVTKAAEMVNKLKEKGKRKVYTFVETVAYQKQFAQELRAKGIRNVEEYVPGNQNKEDRLWTISGAIVSGKVLFPKTGAQTLIDQMLSLGTERYDDLVDALTTLVINVLKMNKAKRNIGMAVGDLHHIYTPKQLEIEKQNAENDLQILDDAYDHHNLRMEHWKKQGIPYHTIPPFYR